MKEENITTAGSRASAEPAVFASAAGRVSVRIESHSKFFIYLTCRVPRVIYKTLPPCSPSTTCPQIIGLPTPTALAPGAMALKTSAPCRIPPSISTSSLSSAASIRSGRASIVAGTLSSWRAPRVLAESAHKPHDFRAGLARHWRRCGSNRRLSAAAFPGRPFHSRIQLARSLCP